MSDTIQRTHYADCWREHHACAVAEVKRLRAALGERSQFANGEQQSPSVTKSAAAKTTEGQQ